MQATERSVAVSAGSSVPVVSVVSVVSVVTVVGASGGLGASVLAAAVSQRARRAAVPTVLVDGCPLAGGLDVTMGLEHEDGLRWPDLSELTGVASGSALVERLPGTTGVPVLSFDRRRRTPSPEVVSAVLTGLGSVCRLLVVDTPPSGFVTDAALALGGQVLVVAGVSVRQLSALAVVAELFAHQQTSVAVCLRGPGGARGRPVRRVVEAEIGLPVVAVLEDDRSIEADLVRGCAPGSRGAGALVRAADQVLGWAVLRQGQVA